MRQAVWVAVVSMAAILLLSWYADGARRNIGFELIERRHAMLEQVKHNDMEKAMESVMDAEKWWREKEETLALFTHHELTDAVGDGIAQTLLALENDEVYELFAGLERLKNAAERLHEQDAFVLKNIL